MRIYKPHERPDVEILVDGTWYPGELRGRWRRGGKTLCNVAWHDRRGATHLTTVPVDRIRPQRPAA
jgi:hypothetical protein